MSSVRADVPHAWQMLDGFVPEARDSLRKVAGFIENVLYNKSPD